jgi:hypothetical protein
LPPQAVNGPTEEDAKKLERVLGYLKGTQDRVMQMKPSGVFQVIAYIDASFSSHPDGKLHSGMIIQIEGVSFIFASKKQKCVSKSPAEAELVALWDRQHAGNHHGDKGRWSYQDKTH